MAEYGVGSSGSQQRPTTGSFECGNATWSPVDAAVVSPSAAKRDLLKTDSAPCSQQISQLVLSVTLTTGSLRCKEVH